MSDVPPLGLDHLRAQRCIAIIRGHSVEHFAVTARTLVSSGVKVLEFPLTTPGLLTILQPIVDEHRGSAYVGVGSVTTLEHARAACKAGAQFLVTPNVDRPVVDFARSAGIAVVVGALSPTEIHTAWSAGATAIKLFPASLGGPAYVRELLNGPFPQIPIIPTGGIEISDVPTFLDAGAVAVGMGSALLGSAPNGGTQNELGERIAAFRSQAGCG